MRCSLLSHQFYSLPIDYLLWQRGLSCLIPFSSLSHSFGQISISVFIKLWPLILLSEPKGVPSLGVFCQLLGSLELVTSLIFIGFIFFVPINMSFHTLFCLSVQFPSGLTYLTLYQGLPPPLSWLFLLGNISWILDLLVLIWASSSGGLGSWDFPCICPTLDFQFYSSAYFPFLFCSKKSSGRPGWGMAGEVIILIFCIFYIIFVLPSHWNKNLAMGFKIENDLHCFIVLQVAM